MKTNMYSIYDTISEVFNKPFVEHNDKSAIRAFNQAMAENTNKNDYVLYHLAEYDDNNGAIKPNNPVKISTGFDVKTISSITPEMQKEDLKQCNQ